MSPSARSSHSLQIVCLCRGLPGRALIRGCITFIGFLRYEPAKMGDSSLRAMVARELTITLTLMLDMLDPDALDEGEDGGIQHQKRLRAYLLLPTTALQARNGLYVALSCQTHDGGWHGLLCTSGWGDKFQSRPKGYLLSHSG